MPSSHRRLFVDLPTLGERMEQHRRQQLISQVQVDGSDPDEGELHALLVRRLHVKQRDKTSLHHVQ